MKDIKQETESKSSTKNGTVSFVYGHYVRPSPFLSGHQLQWQGERVSTTDHQSCMTFRAK